MSDVRSVPALNETDYGAIEAAVMETARGRWFMAEFARRNRHSDTEMLLEAMTRIEHAMSGERAVQQIERVRFDLLEMSKTISRLKIEVATPGAEGEQTRFMEATEVLDAVVRTTESATSSILEAAEQIQEAAWTLREAGSDHALCDVLDRRAADIYTACAFQDLTAQRTQKVVRTLRFLEGRINALIDAWSTGGGDKPGDEGGLPSGTGHSGLAEAMFDVPAAPLSQSDIDVVIVEHEYTPIDYEHSYMVPDFAATGAPAHEIDDLDIAFSEIPAPAAFGEGAMAADDVAFADPRRVPGPPITHATHATGLDTLAELDGLSDSEKLKLFR